MISNYSPRVEISLDNLLHNLNLIRTATDPTRNILAVIKDCAYGCGSVMIARTLEQRGGVSFFAVARPQEAFVLRNEGIEGSILVLGEATSEQLQTGWKRNIIFTCNDLSDLENWITHKNKVRFHLNIDTGMSRMGLAPDELDHFAAHLQKKSDYLLIEGVFTHLACADVPGTASVDLQLSLFKRSLARLRSQNITFTHVHFENSAALMRSEQSECTLVRPGIALYGCKPDPSQDFPLQLRPVASLKGTVVKMKKVPADTPVSYGAHYVTSEETWIATVAMGYAHGVPRFLSNRGDVLIGKKKYRIAGNVTMDYLMIDAGRHPSIKVGDEAVAIGYQGGQCISPDEIAVMGKTIGYEILCNLGTSIERFYLLHDSIVLRDKGSIF